MEFGYEAKILETFYGFYEKGFVYKGLKPVYWCIHDRTALAEAEVEYEMHTSPSVYVRYKLTSDAGEDRSELAGQGCLHDHLDDDAVDAAGDAGGGVRAGAGVRGAGGRRRICISWREAAVVGEGALPADAALTGDLKSRRPGDVSRFPGQRSWTA